MKLTVPLLAILFLATACESGSQGETGVSPSLENQVQDAGVFGLVIGMDSSEVYSPSFFDQMDLSDSEYRFEGEWSKAMGMTMYLTLDKGRVYEITLDMECTTTSANDSLFQIFQGRLDELYGKSHPAPGYATWSTGSRTGRLVEVSLVDESFELGRPRIMMNWLEHYDRKYSP